MIQMKNHFLRPVCVVWKATLERTAKLLFSLSLSCPSVPSQGHNAVTTPIFVIGTVCAFILIFFKA